MICETSFFTCLATGSPAGVQPTTRTIIAPTRACEGSTRRVGLVWGLVWGFNRLNRVQVVTKICHYFLYLDLVSTSPSRVHFVTIRRTCTNSWIAGECPCPISNLNLAFEPFVRSNPHETESRIPIRRLWISGQRNPTIWIIWTIWTSFVYRKLSLEAELSDLS